MPPNRSPESDAWFNESIRAELPHLRRAVRSMAGAGLDVDELEQRVLLRVWANWHTVGPLARPARRAWISRTAYTIVVDEVRRQNRQPVDLVTAVPEDARIIADTAEVYSRREDMRGLIEAVRRLRRTDRELVLDRVLCDDSMADLARRHGLTESALRKRLSRVRKRLTDPRKHGFALSVLLAERRMLRSVRTRCVDPLASAPAKALSIAMSSVLVVTVVPTSGVGARNARPAGVAHGDPAAPRGLAVAVVGAVTAGPRLPAGARSRPAGRFRARLRDGRPASPDGVRVTACLLTTCATAGGSDRDGTTTVPGDEVYVDLPPKAGGRQGVTQNEVKVCDVFPSTPPDTPAGCERHP